MGAGLLLGVGSPQVASAATLTITANVSGNAGTIEVIGHGFPGNDPVTVEFNPNWSDSLLTDYTFNTLSNGTFDKKLNDIVTASCQTGVIAFTDRAVSNQVTVNLAGQGCTPASITASIVNPGFDDRIALRGTHFTPGTTATYTVTGPGGVFLTSGPLNICGPQGQTGPYPPAPAGQLDVNGSCAGLMVLSQAICNEPTGTPMNVSVSDDWTFFTAPSVTVINQQSFNGRCPG